MLPFRVAVVPFDVEALDDSGRDADETDRIVPELDESRAREAVREAVGSRFVDVVLLSFPSGTTRDQFEALSPDAKDEHWIRTSIEREADLILVCALKASGSVRPERNEKFWLNLPLFLVGGPLCYFANDTTYSGEARLRAALHELVPIQEGRATLRNELAEVARFEVRFDDVTLDFLDRAKPANYLASFVVPPGFLAQDNDRVRERVGAEIVDGLAAGLAREIHESESSIVMAERLADFFLDPGVTVEPAGADIIVRGEVALRRGSGERMRQFAVHYGDRRITAELEVASLESMQSAEQSAHADEYVRVPLLQNLSYEPGVDRIRIELTQGGRERIRRRFTVPVPRLVTP